MGSAANAALGNTAAYDRQAAPPEALVHSPRAPEYVCDGDEMQDSAGCEETTTGDAAELPLAWGAFAPEEDPGYISTDVRRDDLVVSVFYDGEEIPEDLRDSGLAGLADDLVALATDPAVGVKTTAAYAEAGTAIDDVMLDWYV